MIHWSRSNWARLRAPSCVGLICLTGACMAMPSGNLEPVAADQSAIRFDHPDFDPELAEHLQQRNSRTGTTLHVARFFGPDSQAVVVVFKAGPGYVVGERSTESYLRDLARGAELEWGDEGHAVSRLGNISYRMLRPAGEPLSCVGFSQTTGDTGDDAHRKGNLVVGLFCQDETRPMTAAVAADLIGKVALAR
jgi:hypothetical protein